MKQGGSEKQIAWAERIITGWTSGFDKRSAELRQRYAEEGEASASFIPMADRIDAYKALWLADMHERCDAITVIDSRNEWITHPIIEAAIHNQPFRAPRYFTTRAFAVRTNGYI